jgi:cyclic pyranopterin phosphate synthase
MIHRAIAALLTLPVAHFLAHAHGASMASIIPLIDIRNAAALDAVLRVAAPAPDVAEGPVADARGRRLHDLRISVTDRCNFRCVYCMPKEVFGRDYPYLPHSDLLTFEEITRIARVFVAQGVAKIRLTGGEPLLRRNIERLVEMLAAIGNVDLTLTTNGALLAKKARGLRDAGLKRVTVSLDSLDDATFRAMNDVDFPVARVLEGIAAAADAGLAPLKINMVVKRGVNESSIVPMARHFKDSGHIVRFIEYMDVGATNGWRMDDVVPAAEIVRRIGAELPLESVDPNYTGEVAERWRYRDGGGEIGVIASVTQAFCRDCTRARLSTDGKVYTCLFASTGHDLRGLLRGGRSDAEIGSAIAALWRRRDDRYSEIRTANTAAAAKVEMSYIGG